MLVLVVDSATPAVTAALAEVSDDAVAVRSERRSIDARAHGELLAPAVEAVLTEAGARPRDLGAIVAGVGPGPFTGLRVGLVTAASIGQTLDVPTYGVCSLDALGRVPQRVLVATDARRREIYWAVYEDGTRLTEPAVDLPATVADRAAELGVAVAVGEGAHKYADVLGVAVVDEPLYPPAEALAALAADRVRAKAPGERLTPLYLRRPDAVAQSVRKPVLP
ncbi:tRNA (adenosine(37)-N6)-threonylcarbamoyltransferase complex dimerization subunit type 1 TsaB [Micromonospora sp. CPCC 205371]|nr:tRNA (adenosine(37)-N6)-threonylcarbamoyltransferase complex dimerization subunit type 1 TsaB [Micromonospora sp. CPCC 205371]